MIVLVKTGKGVGARADIYRGERPTLSYIGALNFHERRDWQACDTTRCPEVGWAIFAEALTLARRQHPNG
jgi:hypothetical protein